MIKVRGLFLFNRIIIYIKILIFKKFCGILIDEISKMTYFTENRVNVIGGERMKLYEEILNNKEKISVIGLGYVGLPLAVEFARHVEVIGYDKNKEKVAAYRQGKDLTNEVGDRALQQTKVILTSDESMLSKAKVHIIAVPTPVNQDKTPDLTPVIEATKAVARNMVRDSIVVYESTVYPGTTEEVCIPILEEFSGLKYKDEFKVGYSPERINPGDQKNKLTNITKIVSGCDKETLEMVARIYELIIEAGVYRAESIKVAEAAKVMENSQRDINIAFMNEMAMIFNTMGINTKEVLKAAGTKWNFLNFTPGLVGGHCIGVDPYYLIYKARALGYEPKLMASGRSINDAVAKHIADATLRGLIQTDKLVKNARVAILGITFKENCPDTRNTKVIDLIQELKSYGIQVVVCDPIADCDEVWRNYGMRLNTLEEIGVVDAIIYAVNHEEFKELTLEYLKGFYRLGTPLMIDIKRVYDQSEAEARGFTYWSL